MADWTQSMKQTFEYYIVDPATWKDQSQLTNVTACSISRDDETDTLGSATIDVTNSLGECYVRVYLVTIQNEITEKHPLGTYLVQSPTINFNGVVTNVSLDAYTPLLELKEKQPPLGYSIPEGENIMEYVYMLCREHARAPVVETESSNTLYSDFVADTDDEWLTYLHDLAANAKYKIDLDELGRIIFSPKQDVASLQPVWTYTSDNSSILYPEITIERDLYGIPNVVEVVYSGKYDTYYARVVNNDENSPISTVQRGREIIYRVTDPDIVGEPTQKQIDEYAEQLLRDLSSLECTISYTHGYCGTRLGDCVRLNCPEAGLENVKAKIISQSIKCEPGCPVSEKAVFTSKLWG